MDSRTDRRRSQFPVRRRELVAALGTAGTVTVAGCGAIRSGTTLSDPTGKSDGSGRRSLHFSSDGEEIGHFGVDGTVASDLIELRTEIWHRDETRVQSIELRVWMPETARDTSAEVAVVSPVEGDSSPPPNVRLSSPDRDLGTVIEIDDLDDLADETISTLELLVRPASETATELSIDCTIELTSSGLLGSDYTLDGRLDLNYPELATKTG
jgi:hypothetical protein